MLNKQYTPLFFYIKLMNMGATILPQISINNRGSRFSHPIDRMHVHIDEAR